MTSSETSPHNEIEFSRPFNLENVGYAGPYRLQLTATAAECEALAKRVSVDHIQSLTAEFMITRGENRRKGIKAEGHVNADVSQNNDKHDASTPQSLQFQIKLNLMEGDEDTDATSIDWETELASDYDCEFYQNSQVDFGEIVAQYLSLELMSLSLFDDLPFDKEAILDHGEKVNPFAALTKIKK